MDVFTTELQEPQRARNYTKGTAGLLASLTDIRAACVPTEAQNIPSQERGSLRVRRSTGVGRATWLGKSWGLIRIGSTRGLERQMLNGGSLQLQGPLPPQETSQQQEGVTGS